MIIIPITRQEQINNSNQIMVNADNYRRVHRQYTSFIIEENTSIDEFIDTVRPDFQKVYKNEDDVNDALGAFYSFSKWNFYKTVYYFEPSFYDNLIDTSDSPVKTEIFNRLPVKSFFISSPHKDYLGMFVTVELKNEEANFCLNEIVETRKEELRHGRDVLWIKDGQTIEEVINIEKKKTKLPDEIWEKCARNIRSAIQIAYYLCAQNSIVKPLHIPKEKHPKRSDGKKFSVHSWDVGYRIGGAFDPTKVSNEDGSTRNRISGPRPHIRRAHWHHYWAGPGKSELILKWIEPTWVNGSTDDVIPTEHIVV